jgi:hypothetical protein
VSRWSLTLGVASASHQHALSEEENSMRNFLYIAAAIVPCVACTVHSYSSPPSSAQPAAAAPPPASAEPEAPIASEPDDPPVVATPLPPQTPVDEPPETKTPPEQLPPGVANGKPPGLEPAAPAAYWIWRAPSGVWKLRTTTATQLHTFRGRVHGVKAPIGAVRPSRTELGDRFVRAPDGNLYFKFTTNGHIDGLDFRVRDNGCVRFDLQLDGGPAPKRIHVGAQSVEPKSNHFVVCP